MGFSLQELSDRAEITDLLVAYCHAQDQEAWHLWDGIFTEDATVDLLGVLPQPLAASALRGFLEQFNATRISGQHTLGNILIALEQDTAHVVSELLAITLQTTDVDGSYLRLRSASVYADDLVRTSAGWRLHRRIVAQKYTEREEITLPETTLAQIQAGAGRDFFA
jgi:hypothetical protein